jgi:hypothetical protein
VRGGAKVEVGERVADVDLRLEAPEEGLGLHALLVGHHAGLVRAEGTVGPLVGRLDEALVRIVLGREALQRLQFVRLLGRRRLLTLDQLRTRRVLVGAVWRHRAGDHQ